MSRSDVSTTRLADTSPRAALHSLQHAPVIRYQVPRQRLLEPSLHSYCCDEILIGKPL